MSNDNKLILQQANEAITNGDYERFLSFCTEDTTWEFVGQETLKGKEAVRQYMAKAYIEPPIFKVDKFISEGDNLTAVGKISMKNDNGDFENYYYCDVWKLRDGKLAELTAFVIVIE